MRARNRKGKRRWEVRMMAPLMLLPLREDPEPEPAPPPPPIPPEEPMREKRLRRRKKRGYISTEFIIAARVIHSFYSNRPHASFSKRESDELDKMNDKLHTLLKRGTEHNLATEITVAWWLNLWFKGKEIMELAKRERIQQEHSRSLDHITGIPKRLFNL